MDIQVNVSINTERASAEQLANLPEEFLRWLEEQVMNWAPDGARVELVNVNMGE